MKKFCIIFTALFGLNVIGGDFLVNLFNHIHENRTARHHEFLSVYSQNNDLIIKVSIDENRVNGVLKTLTPLIQPAVVPMITKGNPVQLTYPGFFSLINNQDEVIKQIEREIRMALSDNV